MADPRHLEIVKQGAAAIAAWLERNPGVRLDLFGADIRRATLFGATLIGADLTFASLAKANLAGANLVGAYLAVANLAGADLTGATLTGADLTAATLTGSNLTEANVKDAICWITAFSDCDLRGCEGLDTVKHVGPSSIGVDTLARTLRGAGGRFTPEQLTFFKGAGVPEELLQELPRIVAEVKYHDCFISHGQPDLEFARKLTDGLKAKGVSCWLYPMDSTPGERTWPEISRKRREAGKMVVLCSAPALLRDGVLKEIEEQIDEDTDKMVPISLDNTWKEKNFKVTRGDRDLKPFLLDRNYADFASLPYEEALNRLLRGLSRKND